MRTAVNRTAACASARPNRHVVKVACLLMAGLVGELGEAGPCQIKKRQSQRIEAALSRPAEKWTTGAG